MAISVDWGSKVITVNQADLTFISGNLYDLDTDQFRKDLKALEAGDEGIVFADTHQHNTEQTLSGVTFARTIEFINNYTITFEDLSYRVRFINSNNNISDVTNLNQVGLLSQNSAGLTTPSVSTADKDDIVDKTWKDGRSLTVGKYIGLK